MQGLVYWITGLSGAGKTTVGTRLYYRIKADHPQAVLLDGDVMKRVFDGQEVDYSPGGRLIRAYKYSQLCKMLSDQGLTVICCTIAMYEEVRRWNRANIPNYLEIFLKADLESILRRDPKGHYKKQGSAMVGVGAEVEFPQNPDLTIINRMDHQVDQEVDRILALSRRPSPGEESETYWDRFYAAKKEIAGPSDFARFALDYVRPGQKIIDLGCGEGRDSLFFHRQGLRVSAIDSSSEAIALIDRQNLPVFAVCDDFVKAKALFCVDYDCVYARWSIHAISLDKQKAMLANVRHSLREGALFLIEGRTVNDAKYGQGQALEKDAFFLDGHYRRFLRLEELSRDLSQAGFEIVHSSESDSYSVQGDDRPTLLRLVAKAV